MNRWIAGVCLLLAVGCGSSDEEPVRLAKLIAAEVPKAREAWQEAAQPNLFLRPGWPDALFEAVKDNPAVREVQVGVRYVDDQYVWTGFAASLYAERRIDHMHAPSDGPDRTTLRSFSRRIRGQDSYALLDPEGGPYSEPVEEGSEPGIWIWERRDGVAVRVDAKDGTPVVLFYDTAQDEEETALPKSAEGKAKSAASSADLDALLKGIQAFRQAEQMLPSGDLDVRLTWAKREGKGHEELNAELTHLTKHAPAKLVEIRVTRIGREGEWPAFQGRPVAIVLGLWQREGTEPLPGGGKLQYRGREGDWVLTSLEGGGRRWVEASTWFTWKDEPIRVDAYVDLEAKEPKPEGGEAEKDQAKEDSAGE